MDCAGTASNCGADKLKEGVAVGDVALGLSVLLILFLIGAAIRTWIKGESSLLDMITTNFFFRIAILALLLYGIHIGVSIQTHFHTIEEIIDVKTKQDVADSLKAVEKRITEMLMAVP